MLSIAAWMVVNWAPPGHTCTVLAGRPIAVAFAFSVMAEDWEANCFSSEEEEDIEKVFFG